MFAAAAQTRQPGPSPEPRPCPTLQSMLRLAGARTDQTVCVAGPSAHAARLALGRLGFEHAREIGDAEGGGPAGDCDIALVTGPSDGLALVALIAGVAGQVRDGGVLVVQEAGVTDDERVRALLAAGGRDTGWCVHDLSRGCLAAFQVLGRTATRRAA